MSVNATITDNWLLQTSAEILERLVDPSTRAEWIEVDGAGVLRTREITLGTMQVLCLASLLEQIVFCDTMHVMNEWSASWAGRSRQLAALLDSSIIREFDPDGTDLRDRALHYQKALCRSPLIAKAAEVAELVFQAGQGSFAGQVLNGTAPYLAQADTYGFLYCPHPVRARFLEQVLYRRPRVADPRERLNTIVNTARVKLAERLGQDQAVTTLTSRTSSIAMLCLRESSQQSSPILTALQMREADEFKRLRRTFGEMQAAIDRGDDRGVRTYLRHVKSLEDALHEVERRLRLRHLDARDGLSEINVWKGLPIRVPDALRRPVIAPRHTTAINRLVTTAATDLGRVLEQSLGIRDPQVVEDLNSFLAR
jgi:hypothetical protein